MIIVGAIMLKILGDPDNPDVRRCRQNAPKVIGNGGATGLSSSFRHRRRFPIVPGLMASTVMVLHNVVGLSLITIGVVAFGRRQYPSVLFPAWSIGCSPRSFLVVA